MRSFTVETITHGRVLIEDAAVSVDAAPGLIVCFHGYGEAAEDILAEVRQIPGAARWNIASVQALNRFYTRRDEKIVANWMTRQDREQAIEDNIKYVDRVLEELGSSGVGEPGSRSVAAPKLPSSPAPKLVLVGFSQGVAMAYRAALRGSHPVAAIIAVGGDIPPELKNDGGVASPKPEAKAGAWPAVLIGAGDSDHWYTAAKVEADQAFLESRGIVHTVVRFAGGHEWTGEFRNAAGEWLTSTPRRGR